MNEIGQDPTGANEAASDGRDIPWLQEQETSPVWDVWHVTYRDVVILDEDNERIEAYNLSTHDLHVQENYDTLKAKILQAAGLP
ncbi:MAG: hypothetical protein R3E97_11675 [Candidatus Eisenbacteria bacterium]